MNKMYRVIWTILLSMNISNSALSSEDLINLEEHSSILEVRNIYVKNGCHEDIKIFTIDPIHILNLNGPITLKANETIFIGKMATKYFYLYGYSTNFEYRWDGEHYFNFENIKYPFMKIMLPLKKHTWTSTLKCMRN